MKIQVLIADDHPVVREGIASMIRRQTDMSVVAEANDGQQAVDLFLSRRPDIALMDLRMPRKSGFEAIEEIRSKMPGANIIVITTSDGDEDIYRALELGARSYLLKDATEEQMLTMIRRVLAGERPLPPEVAERLAAHLPRTDLTHREREVLEQIAGGHSNKEIAALLGITEATVKAHVNSILSKLGVSDRTQAVLTAMKRGIIH